MSQGTSKLYENRMWNGSSFRNVIVEASDELEAIKSAKNVMGPDWSIIGQKEVENLKTETPYNIPEPDEDSWMFYMGSLLTLIIFFGIIFLS